MSAAACDVCAGAIPDGKAREAHTALCAEVVRESLEQATTERGCFDETLRRTAQRWRERAFDLRHSGSVEKEWIADALERCAKELDELAVPPAPLSAAPVRCID